MKFGIDVDCTKDKMTEIYNQFVEVMMLAKPSIGDCFLEDQKNCYLENQKYCMLQPEDSNENLAALLYDLHLDYPTETYFQE